GHHGACVLGSEVLINYLINFARPFIYTTALPDTVITSIDCAWKYIKDHPQLAAKLKENIELYRELIGNQMAGVNVHSPIQRIPVKGNKQAQLFSDILRKQGFDIRPILSPTVKTGEERLRVSLHSFNTAKQIESLSEVIANQLK
ncbi:MAG: aminotransferase class I/II-fold pyridoxal phosphate-dependent enzyme, partial [Cyclobacteriaceae bacterium]|nr:aminotransferase class I/II-fold pyridoxal phosphate-dependent enzyme [Cyclobacteriaceae bacterium]